MLPTDLAIFSPSVASSMPLCIHVRRSPGPRALRATRDEHAALRATFARATLDDAPAIAAEVEAGRLAGQAPADAAASVPAADPDNPLLAEWTGSYGGVPPFDQVRIEHFKPALEAAMAQELAEVERIAANPQPATFENTIAALERTGRVTSRVGTVYGIWGGNMSTPEFQAVEREMAPRLAAYSDQITQNAALFRRIEAVYNSPQKSSWTPEQQRLAWRYYTNFVRAGAQLDAAKKARMSEINQRLAQLYTNFGQNVLKDENEQTVVIENEADLAGLPQSLLPTNFTGDEVFSVTAPVNTDGGKLRGFEINYQQPFKFLPGKWSNFGVLLNYTWVDSEIDYITSATGATPPVTNPSETHFSCCR